ncbi:MAG: glycosyltransferase [Actinomycetota bacterium]|nr:glycosyltransferase [Actinomycetota bacterium]
MIKIGIFDRYLSTLGGGERYSCKMAEVLSKKDIYKVDLITDLYSDLSEVSERLNLDLSRVNLKILPFISDDYSQNITGDYDVFINATYLSAFTAKAKHNIYVCYFPTPFDSDFRFIHRFLLFFFRKPAKWLYKKSEKFFKSPDKIEITEGIYELKRFMLKRGSWSTGEIVIKADRSRYVLNNDHLLESTEKKPDLFLRLGIKNPEDTHLETMNVKISVYPSSFSGKPSFNVSDKLDSGQKKSIEIPVQAGEVSYIKISSDVFVPSVQNDNKQDSRKLGVVLYDETAISLPKKIFFKILGFIPMFLITYPSGFKFLESYNEILSISDYSKYWIKKYWKKESRILFPPVDTDSFEIGSKEKIILSVGRFFPEHHNKKQYELARAFIDMIKSNPDETEGYRLILAGGLENREKHIEYVKKIREISQGYPIEIMTNISWEDLKNLFSKAMIFWHASGLNEDENKNPAKFEHFGITTVEAMSAGCIPIVINKGGQKEIIEESVNGFKFEDIAGLKKKTINVIRNYKDIEKIKFKAREDSQRYSNKNFEENLLKIISGAVERIKKE